jgi:hypothetical protein
LLAVSSERGRAPRIVAGSRSFSVKATVTLQGTHAPSLGSHLFACVEQMLSIQIENARSFELESSIGTRNAGHLKGVARLVASRVD